MNKSNAGIIPLNQMVAQPSELKAVQRIVEITINKIYPLYYPCDVVKFFLDHHAPDRILADIEAGSVFLFEANSATIGTGTIRGNEIKRVFVLPECQGRGYGSVIMTQLENIIFGKYRTVKLDSSFPAFGMYLKRGYKSRAWREIVMTGGQILCYHEMEKEYVQGSCNPPSNAEAFEKEQ